MAEKEKCSEPANNQRYPAKDQIIARLVQIREYTEKAEETLSSMPPNSQNDPKFCQLQEMIAEMRDTEKKLVDILRDYDMESPIRNRLNMENAQGLTHTLYASNFSGEVEDDFSLVEAHVSNVDPELMAEREKLKKRCLESQNRIEALEKQRKYLLEACNRVSENGGKMSPISSPAFLPDDGDINKRLQVVREADTLIFSRRCQSAEGLISSEEPCENEATGPNFSELTDKRLEIHNIISEIALLRRAKDESARKIELLQQALKSSEVSENGLNFDSPGGAGAGDKSENAEFVEELMTEKENGSDESNALGSVDWMSDSFSQTITRKLVEIQTMREKLEALQSLVHTIPTPSAYHSGNGLEMTSSGSNLSNEVCKETGLFELAEKVREICQWTGEAFRPGLNTSAKPKKSCVKMHSQLPMNIPVKSENGRSVNPGGGGDDRYNLEATGLEYASQIKSGYPVRGHHGNSDLELRRGRNRLTKKCHSRESENREDFEGGTQRTFPCNASHRLLSPVRSFSVYNSREVKPVPIRPQPTAFSDTMIFPGPRNDREDGFLYRNHDSFQGQRSREVLSGHDRIVGNPLVDDSRHWMGDATSSSPGFRGTNSESRLPPRSDSNNVAIENFLSESNSMLKHVVSSVGLIATAMANQKKQLDSIKNSVDRLSGRFEALLGEVEVPRLMSEESELRRNNIIPGIYPVDNKPMGEMLASTSTSGIETRGNGICEQSTFYHGSRSHPNVFQEMNTGFHSSRDSKGINPSRDMWGSASATNSLSNANYPPEQLNLRAYPGNSAGSSSNSAFYSPNPSSCMKVKRPWVSPSAQLEPNRLMLNNQVPPGNRTNNYWDNFRSQSRQNVLSSSSKSNESYNTVVTLNPETTHNQSASTSGSNNFNRSETRHEKNPGAKPIKAVMMKHFVENIGSKKRNQEQQRQVLPQRSVSVGSMPHSGDNSNPAVAGPSHAFLRNGINDVSGDTACFGMNKRYPNNPGDRFSNKLTAKEANVLRQAQLGQDCLKEVCSKITQLRNDHIRHRTLDALRNFVAQSVLQDEIESHHMDSPGLRGYATGDNIQLQSCDPPHASGVTQVSTPSSRSGDLNEVLWMDSADPYAASSSRVVLPYPGADSNESDSQAGATSRRTDLASISDELYCDPHIYLPGDSREASSTRPRGNEPVSSSARSASRERTMNELWSNSMDVTFLSNDPRLPPYMQMDRKNSAATSSESRQDALNDLCVETEGVFFSSRLPPYLRMDSGSRDTTAQSLMGRYNEAQETSSDTGSKREKTPINSSCDIPEEASTSINVTAHVSSKCMGSETSYHVANKHTIDSSEHCDRRRDTSRDLENASTMTPIRDLSAVEADLDANLLNVSGSTFLTEPASPDVLPTYSSNSTFSSNVKYKGRSMSSTNNPWVGTTDMVDVGEPSQESGPSKDDITANEEVAELTEERTPNSEPSPFEKKDTNL